MRTFLGLLGLALVVTATGCGGPVQPRGEKTIVAAFYPLAWIAEQVGGARVRVVDLTPAGAEPHDIELTPSDVQQIQDAALVLYLGNGFQPSVEKAVESRHGPSLDLLAGQTLRRHLGEGGSGEAIDPHVWLDPTRLATMVTAVGRELGRTREAARLAERLKALDRELAAGLASCRRHEI